MNPIAWKIGSQSKNRNVKLSHDYDPFKICLNMLNTKYMNLHSKIQNVSHPPNSLGLNLTVRCGFPTYTLMMEPLSGPLHQA